MSKARKTQGVTTDPDLRPDLGPLFPVVDPSRYYGSQVVRDRGRPGWEEWQ